MGTFTLVENNGDGNGDHSGAAFKEKFWAFHHEVFGEPPGL